MPGNSSHHLNDPNNRWQPLEHDSSSRPMLSDTNPLLLPSRNYQNPSSFNQSSIVPNNHGPWCSQFCLVFKHFLSMFLQYLNFDHKNSTNYYLFLNKNVIYNSNLIMKFVK